MQSDRYEFPSQPTVLIEYRRESLAGIQNGQTLRSDIVRQDLDRIRHRQPRPGQARRAEEQRPSADFVHKQRRRDPDEKRPDRQAAVDERLLVRAADADRVEDAVQVVRHEAVAGALREERRQDDQQETLSVAGRLEQGLPSVCRIQLLETDRFLDFVELGHDETVVGVAGGVVLPLFN